MKRFLLTLLLVFSLSSAWADVIQLETGETIEGKIVEHTFEFLKIETGIDYPITYYMDEVSMINGLPVGSNSQSTSDGPSMVSPGSNVPASGPSSIDIPIQLPGQMNEKIENFGERGLEVVNSIESAITSNPEVKNTYEQIKKQVSNEMGKMNVSYPEEMDPAEIAAGLGVAAAGLGFTFFLFLGLHVVVSLPIYVMAKKTRAPKAWMAWIPILQLYSMCLIAHKPGIWVLLMFVPFVNFVIMILLWMGIAKARLKPAWVGLFILVPFLNILLPYYLAFSK